jgi:hypothetical protein
MSFTVKLENGGRDLELAPTETRPYQMQYQLFGNGKFHVVPPEKQPARYTRME